MYILYIICMLYIIYYTNILYITLYHIYPIIYRGRELYKVAISWYYHESDRYN